MSTHHARQHATWSASATERNVNCPGSLTLASRVTEQRENEAAAWGSCAHQIADRCLKEDENAFQYLDTEETHGKFSFKVDEEMIETVQTFTEYVRSGLDEESKLFIEQEFSLEKLHPPFDAGGTCDAIIYTPRNRHVEVVDLKGGRGVVVEAIGNSQLRTYALGAMLANPGLDVEKITVTIVQPRAPHKDGRIRSETFHVADLVEWTTDLVAAMKRSATASSAYLFPREDDETTNSAWNAKYLNAGDWCKFCPAAGFCPALEQRALDAAGVWFDDTDMPRLANSPDSMDAAEIAKKLDMLDLIQEWMNALRAYAHAQAEHGVEIPGYQLADKIGYRQWVGDEEDVRSKLVNIGLKPYELNNTKLKSPAQIDKLLGSKRKHLIEGLVERPVRGTNLVAAGKTTRPAVQSMAARYFEAT